MAAGARFSYARALKVAGRPPNDVCSQTASLLLASRGCTRPPDPTRTTNILREFPFPPFSPFWKIESGLIASGYQGSWPDATQTIAYGGAANYEAVGRLPTTLQAYPLRARQSIDDAQRRCVRRRRGGIDCVPTTVIGR